MNPGRIPSRPGFTKRGNITNMSDSTKLGIAILILFGAFVFFFFAFHPNGVKNVMNPGDVLKFLITGFESPDQGPPDTVNLQPTPTGQEPPANQFITGSQNQPLTGGF